MRRSDGGGASASAPRAREPEPGHAAQALSPRRTLTLPPQMLPASPAPPVFPGGGPVGAGGWAPPVALPLGPPLPWAPLQPQWTQQQIAAVAAQVMAQQLAGSGGPPRQ